MTAAQALFTLLDLYKILIPIKSVYIWCFGWQINPLVFILFLSLVWVFIICLLVRPVDVAGEIWFWKRRMFVWLYWLYALLNNIWIGTCAYIYYKWGDVVLGASQQDTATALSDLSWVLTMFTPGLGIALFYFGVSEPIFNLEAALSDQTKDSSYNDSSQQAMLITYYHFGLHTWAPFVLVGLLLSLAHYRHGLPLTMRSAFYPLLRERTFGWCGDLVDLVSAICALIGVCVPLALASMQVILLNLSTLLAPHLYPSTCLLYLSESYLSLL
jgi:choline-glycine betaine transporter